MENGNLKLIYRLKMVIFHSYVSLPEGTVGEKSGGFVVRRSAAIHEKAFQDEAGL